MIWKWCSCDKNLLLSMCCMKGDAALLQLRCIYQKSGREEFVKSRRSWAELYAFEVDRAGDAPVFRQIYLQLRSAILSGALRRGMTMHSTRESADQRGVSSA